MKAPYKILYSNDMTHILYCASPYHKRGEPFTKQMLEASVDETAGTGVDVHMLQPGLGWVPMWQSKILPPARHWDWQRKTYQAQEPDSFLKYLLDGGDIVADFTRRCRLKKLTPFVSLRMNDTHHVNPPCEFYQTHPEHRLETGSNSWRDRGQNWAVKEVRDYKFNFLREICENYDIDGLELDFMRFPSLFRTWETSSEQRRRIMSDFISDIRETLDKTSSGPRRWLCLRIPADHRKHEALGIDVHGLSENGVNIFNLSYGYYTAQNGDLALIRSLAPGAAIYAEMTSCASVGRAVEKGDGDLFEFIKTSETMFQTTAAAAYAAGLDGVSLFNFVYYREHGSSAKKGASFEPPFGVIKTLRDKELLKRRPAHCFTGSQWESGPLPKCFFISGQYADLAFENVMKNADASRAVMRIHINTDNGGDWETWFNDRPVKIISSPELPFDTPKREQKIISWEIPVNYIRDGENHIEIRSKDTGVSVIDFMELIIW